jgi:hypothetical protein
MSIVDTIGKFIQRDGNSPSSWHVAVPVVPDSEIGAVALNEKELSASVALKMDTEWYGFATMSPSAETAAEAVSEDDVEDEEKVADIAADFD